jgi:hypothetical protein
MKMTKNFKKYIKDIINDYVYREKISQFLKISMAYNIGVANFGRSRFST